MRMTLSVVKTPPTVPRKVSNARATTFSSRPQPAALLLSAAAPSPRPATYRADLPGRDSPRSAAPSRRPPPTARRLLRQTRQLAHGERHKHDRRQNEEGEQGDHDDGDSNPTRDQTAEKVYWGTRGSTPPPCRSAATGSTCRSLPEQQEDQSRHDGEQDIARPR